MDKGSAGDTNGISCWISLIHAGASAKRGGLIFLLFSTSFVLVSYTSCDSWTFKDSLNPKPRPDFACRHIIPHVLDKTIRPS